MRIFKRLHSRLESDQEATAESERIHDEIEAQWPEVRELTSWAKQTRERNHLTELFITTLGGKA